MDHFLTLDQKLRTILKNIRQVFNILFTNFEKNNTNDLISACNSYMDFIIKADFDRIEQFFKEDKLKRCIR
jgi:hypothetical protein